MIQATYHKHTLHFTFEAGTSRGVLTERDTFYLTIWDTENPDCVGIGECAPLRGLSIDDRPGYEARLNALCAQINTGGFAFSEDTILQQIGDEWPSIRFGVETAWLDLQNGGRRLLFDHPFGRGETGIGINGLIWMGNESFMRQQIDAKLEAGFRCLKLKIGAIDFETECALLGYIRRHYTPEQITLRVDANGAFAPKEALEKLKRLAGYDLHSIEQPIRAGQTDEMAALCAVTPVPVALDEELIGISSYEQKQKLLETIRPQYIILKPSLVGGFRHCREWIALAEKQHMGWWITSALESNIGLNAIAQFTATLNNPLPQGLGTGQLYHNNIPSPLEIRQGFLWYAAGQHWGVL
jgi:o-succinylbenzoate synthase